MDQICYSVEFAIKPGRLEDFRRVVREEFVPHVRSAEPRAQIYQWYLSDDGTTAYLLTWYPHSDDFRAHIEAAVGSERFANILDTCDIVSLRVFGEPDEALSATLADHDATTYAHLDGFSRNQLVDPA